MKEGKDGRGGMEKPKSGSIEDTILHTMFYPNEVRFFAGCSPGRTDARFPKCYFAASRDKSHALLMEDLSFAEFGDCRLVSSVKCNLNCGF